VWEDVRDDARRWTMGFMSGKLTLKGDVPPATTPQTPLH
jgi:hypothetical protein